MRLRIIVYMHVTMAMGSISKLKMAACRWTYSDREIEVFLAMGGDKTIQRQLLWAVQNIVMILSLIESFQLLATYRALLIQ